MRPVCERCRCTYSTLELTDLVCHWQYLPVFKQWCHHLNNDLHGPASTLPPPIITSSMLFINHTLGTQLTAREPSFKASSFTAFTASAPLPNTRPLKVCRSDSTLQCCLGRKSKDRRSCDQQSRLSDRDHRSRSTDRQSGSDVRDQRSHSQDQCLDCTGMTQCSPSPAWCSGKGFGMDAPLQRAHVRRSPVLRSC